MKEEKKMKLNNSSKKNLAYQKARIADFLSLLEKHYGFYYDFNVVYGELEPHYEFGEVIFLYIEVCCYGRVRTLPAGQYICQNVHLC